MELFKIIENEEKYVIVKIKENLSNLDLARYPYIRKNMEYINITKGDKNMFTIIYKDGKSLSFSHNELVPDEIRMLRTKTIHFLHDHDIYVNIVGFEPPEMVSLYTCDLKKGNYIVSVEFKSGIVHKGFDSKKAGLKYINDNFTASLLRTAERQAAVFDYSEYKIIEGNILI